MKTWEKARSILVAGEVTCAICKNDTVLTSVERGVKPLVAWLESGLDLRGCAVADKVVGMGAAYLYVLLGARAVYADVISDGACKVLDRCGIDVAWTLRVPAIINRRGDGICPFEEAVREAQNADEAYAAIRAKMKELHIEL